MEQACESQNQEYKVYEVIASNSAKLNIWSLSIIFKEINFKRDPKNHEIILIPIEEVEKFESLVRKCNLTPIFKKTISIKP